MSDDSHPNSAVNAAATTNIHHANLQDLPLSAARRLCICQNLLVLLERSH
ncbi:MAG: hypothetical protein V7L11_06360 [Nostoc sp.]